MSIYGMTKGKKSLHKSSIDSNMEKIQKRLYSKTPKWISASATTTDRRREKTASEGSGRLLSLFRRQKKFAVLEGCVRLVDHQMLRSSLYALVLRLQGLAPLLAHADKAH
ncbi:hypothetical protein LOAG_13878 [Loa loa]|uniref:ROTUNDIFOLIA like 8 n=1 Tax=Loa loa TaxID=7209 RepID=A0A1I7VSW7_LOALO|nr:hypothetical protein LOAG_13878 [Loa loa]EFO14639.1 hypothetical protein LOAG_13878 [Loa loa]